MRLRIMPCLSGTSVLGKVAYSENSFISTSVLSFSVDGDDDVDVDIDIASVFVIRLTRPVKCNFIACNHMKLTQSRYKAGHKEYRFVIK